MAGQPIRAELRRGSPVRRSVFISRSAVPAVAACPFDDDLNPCLFRTSVTPLQTTRRPPTMYSSLSRRIRVQASSAPIPEGPHACPAPRRRRRHTLVADTPNVSAITETSEELRPQDLDAEDHSNRPICGLTPRYGAHLRNTRGGRPRLAVDPLVTDRRYLWRAQPLAQVVTCGCGDTK